MLHCLIGYSEFSISECPEGDMSTIFATIMWVCMSLQLYVFIIVCVHVCVPVYVCMYVYVRMYVYVCVYVCVCMCVLVADIVTHHLLVV